MIQVIELSKSYGDMKAVDGISFSVERGEILGFLGPNGAGKSTTMKMITGFIAPTAGTAKVGGHDILEQPIQVKRLIGYLPESAPSYKAMTVEEFLFFIAQVRDLGNQAKPRLEEVLELTSLTQVRRQTIDTLSKGYRQRVGFAQALIHDPPVLILDEPTDGLDPNQKFEVRKLITRMAKDKVIILSTHILEEMEAVCTRALIINQGKLVADGTPAELLAQSTSHHVVALRPVQSAPLLIQALQALPEVKEVTNLPDGQILVTPQGGKNLLPQVQQLASREGVALEEVYLKKGQMDEVFRKLTLSRAGGAA